jgi:hypothetical protein
MSFEAAERIVSIDILDNRRSESVITWSPFLVLWQCVCLREVGVMSLEGIWSSDIGGAYGWEPIGTMFLKAGRMKGGGRNHYSLGTYEEKGDGTIVFHIDINQFGKQRALFGQKSEKLSIVVTARQDGDKMIGEATMPEHAEYGIAVRFKRRGDLQE